MKRLSGLAAAAALALALAAPATAEASVYHYTGTAVTSGDIDVFLTTSDTLNALGGYDLLSATGTILGNALTGTGVVPPSGSVQNNGSYLYDNTLFAAAPYFDYNGWLLSTVADNWNFYQDSDNSLRLYNSDGSTGSRGDAITNASLTPAPEPATLSVVGAALIGFGVMKRRRNQSRAT